MDHGLRTTRCCPLSAANKCRISSSIFYSAFSDERLVTNYWEKSALLNQALSYVGTQEQANAMFAQMVINESVPSNLRAFTVLSLYGAHRADTPTGAEQIQGRMQLLENLRRDVKDDRTLRAIDEAQSNLQRLYQGETAPKTPASAPPSPAPAPGNSER